MRNVFIHLHELSTGSADRRFGTGWEDLFTDQLAFFLRCDLPAASELAARLMNSRSIEVVEVMPQVSGTSGTPDLTLQLSGGDLIILEHKVEATLQPHQLERYLGLGSVALVSRRNLSVPEGVLSDGNYLRPEGREHYSWQDVFRYLPIPERAVPGYGGMREAFRSYMRELGFAPTNLVEEWRSLFEDRTDEDHRQVQRQFGQLLNRTRSTLEKRYGLRCTDVSHKGKRAHAPDGVHWSHLYVYPARIPAEMIPGPARSDFEPGYEALTIDIVFADAESAEIFAERLPRTVTDSLGHAWYRIGPRPISRRRTRVGFASPLPPYLESEEALEDRLNNVIEDSLSIVFKHLD